MIARAQMDRAEAEVAHARARANALQARINREKLELDHLLAKTRTKETALQALIARGRVEGVEPKASEPIGTPVEMPGSAPPAALSTTPGVAPV